MLNDGKLNDLFNADTKAEIEELNCDKCDKKCSSQKGLKMHITRVHTQKRKRSSINLNDSSIKKGEKSKEQNVSINKEEIVNIQCEVCNQKCLDEQKMKRHKRDCHKKYTFSFSTLKKKEEEESYMDTDENGSSLIKKQSYEENINAVEKNGYFQSRNV